MLRKIIRIAIIVVALAFIILQFVRPDFTNPPVIESETLYAATQVPADVKAVLVRSCNDCHSNETEYPWYSRISPLNWFLSGHIDEGRRELNFSLWNTYSADKKIRKLDEICEMVEGEAMPLPSYLWIHRDAVLTKADRELLCGWAKAESERLSN